MFYLILCCSMYDFYSFTYLDQIGNPLKVPNPLTKEDLSKDLLKKKKTTKIISIQEPEQGKIIQKIFIMNYKL